MLGPMPLPTGSSLLFETGLLVAKALAGFGFWAVASHVWH